MKRIELYRLNRSYYNKKKYKFSLWSDYDFNQLDRIMYIRKTGGGDHSNYNDCIMMLDTETSKKVDADVWHNHVVAWTLSIRAYDINICTLYGHKPSELVDCILKIHNTFKGEKSVFYIHNLSYDWIFIRKFCFKKMAYPVKQLNTKSLYPIYIEFENGIILRDSLILAQRSLEKWANDLDVEHKKSVGKWDYNKLRNQFDQFDNDELEYIEHDTLAGVECIQKTMNILNKRIYSMPWTATGIPREAVRKLGKNFKANENFKKQLLSLDEQMLIERVYHGGYTHGNRYYYNRTVTGDIKAYDFASSYPFVMLSCKFPSEKFTKMDNCSLEDIILDTDNAYFFKLIMINVKLRDYGYPMPILQYSKCVKCINPILDNGRVLEADYLEIYLTELDGALISEYYICDKHICTQVYASYKDYLPKWYTDYIYQLFTDKTKLKGGDPVLYSIKKAELNSLYGMTVQKPIRGTIVEDYTTGLYKQEDYNPEELYSKYATKRTNVLNYQVGVWVTAYAMYNLFQLGKCCGEWLYTDTDSCYGLDWDIEKVDKYNQKCKDKLLSRGYGPVNHNQKDYWLGVAELDGEYSEFRVIGAKRYCVRDAVSGKLKITVAGVPKNGAQCLNDDIENFKTGFIFSGEKTGKKTHTHFYVDDIYIDDQGNETGDSIDLSPCDYLIGHVDFEGVFINEVQIQVYDQ